jgi:uncharacterized protein YndB with AHSA1/START domain
MGTFATNAITVSVQVTVPINKVWKLWTTPEDIKQWNNLSTEWHTTYVDNDLRPGGNFLFKMGLKNGSFNFDFTGTYDEVIINELITYTLNDGRKSTVIFVGTTGVTITETFEPTATEPADLQREFCLAVLGSFKQYAESQIKPN